MDASFIASFQGRVDSDLAGLLSGEFSEPALLIFNEDSDTEVRIDTRGIFDETFQEIDPDTSAIVMSREPRLTVDEKEIQDVVHRRIEDDPERSWVAIVRGERFYIASPERDGTGLILLRLKRT